MATAPHDTLLRHIRRLAAPGELPGADRQLLDDFTRRRDETAFAALVARHGPMVLRVCRRVLHHEQDAEDAFQATFLVLARHTASIRNREALASWLHGVAYRTAMKARQGAARRRNHEAKLQARKPPPAAGPTWDDVQAVLDEEVQRLPELLRAAFVLCALEGKSGPEAAAALGVKVGTVSSRLTRARQLLQQRLARRGIKLSALLSALSLAERAGRAGLPARLAQVAIRSGLWVAAGEPAAGVIPPHVATLAAGVTRAMFRTKAKVATAVLCAIGLFAAAGALTCPALDAREAEPPAAQEKDTRPAKPDQPAPATDAEPPATIRAKGRVLDPDDKPVAGAKVYLMDRAPAKELPPVRATTDSEGRYDFTVAPARLQLNHGYINPWASVFLVATAEGYGPGLSKVGKPERELERTLRLVPDHPVQGRVRDLEGKPVAKAKVQVFQLSVPKQGDLTAFLDDLKARPDGYPAENQCLTTAHNPALARLVPEAVTDEDGRFRLTGIGRERVVGMTISGPSIETRQVRVRTRPGETLTRLEWKDYPTTGTLTYYGSQFEHAAGPTRVIEGVVRDKDTGKPLVGAQVVSEKLAGDDLHGRDFVRTTTDQNGRYRLVGMPKGPGNIIRALPPEGLPYVAETKGADDPPGLETVRVDFGLRRGVWIQGRVTDKNSGKPAAAHLDYFIFADNPALKRFSGAASHRQLETREDGTFRFIGVPGRSLVAARAAGDRYVVGVGAEKYKDRDQYGHLATSPPCLAIGYHTLVEVEAAPDAESVECPVVLDPGRTLTGTVLGPDDRPLAGARICGVKSYAYTYWEGEPLNTAEFKVFGLSPARPRRLLFLHEGQHLAGSLLVRGDEKAAPTVKLEPWGAVTGRLVTGTGQPPADAELRFLFGAKFDDSDDGSHPSRTFPVAKDGSFRVEGLVPGVKYNLAIMQKGRFTGYVFQNFSMKCGETKDLGEVQPKD
jgi:RNA polymerase sigma factor (sigma-70 family)